MSDVIVNKVALSALENIDLEDYFPSEDVVEFDIKPFLFMEMIIKEKDFRESLSKYDWSLFTNKIVAVTCSADAIIPQWAYMLIASYLQPVADEIIFGDRKAAVEKILLRNIDAIDNTNYQDKRIIVKGCGDLNAGPAAYLAITKKLLPVAKSIMYGEACSTVPVYKKK